MDGQNGFAAAQSPQPPVATQQPLTYQQHDMFEFEDFALEQQQQSPSPLPPQQQQQITPQPQAEPFPTNMNHLTTIDGQNMWRNWKRNFTSPLMAIWDLVDNAFDAAEPVGGRLQVFADQNFDVNDMNGVEVAGTASGGLVLMNTSDKEIKHIDKILKPYSSSKTDSQDAIGENGIGVKQAAATLADLSFVMTKNDPKIPSGSTTISFGIIAKDLQNANGVFFPSTQMEVPCGDELVKNDGRADHAIVKGFEDLVAKFGDDVQTVLAQYGGGRGICSYQKAIKGFAFHIKNMIFSSKWGGSKYVYCMIIHQLLHGGSEDGMSSTTQLDQLNNMHSHRANRVQEKNKAWTLMEQIQREAPRQYLHVDPAFTFEVGVNGNHVQFSHWQRRMAEFTKVFLPINKTEDKNNKDGMPMSYFNGLAPAQTQSSQSPARSQVSMSQTQPSPALEGLNALNNMPGTSSTQHEADGNTYNLQVYCGFDTLRVGEKGKTDCLLLIYSRKSGRLVKVFEDGRSFLGLSNTSDGYCQGLTIIVDDKDGMLPLNPTKQDLAFSEQAYGAIHEKNLKFWVKAAAKCFYDYHLKKFHGKKLLLKQGVISLRTKAQELVQDNDNFDLEGTLDNFPILSMNGLRPAFNGGHFHLRFDDFGGTALMRFQYPAAQDLGNPNNGPMSSGPPSKKQREAKAAAMGMTLAQYDFHYPKQQDPHPSQQLAQQLLQQQQMQIQQIQMRQLAQNAFLHPTHLPQDFMNTHAVQQPRPEPRLNMPPAKKRKSGIDNSDSSSGSEDDTFNQQQQHHRDQRAERRLQEARNEVTKLRAEVAAMKSQHQDETKDLQQEKKDLATENKELKDLIIEMRDKKNDYKDKYKTSQKEVSVLKRRLDELGGNEHIGKANEPVDQPREQVNAQVLAQVRVKEEEVVERNDPNMAADL